MTNSLLVTYNPLSQNDSGKRTHEIYCITPHYAVGQLSVEKFADKNRKAGCNFAVGFENNTLIVQRFPSSSYSS